MAHASAARTVCAPAPMFPTTFLVDAVMCAASARPRVRRPAAVASGSRRRSSTRALALALAVLVVGVLGCRRAWPPPATVTPASTAQTVKTGDLGVVARL